MLKEDRREQKIVFWCTSGEKEILQERAQMSSYNSVSAYLRHVGLSPQTISSSKVTLEVKMVLGKVDFLLEQVQNGNLVSDVELNEVHAEIKQLCKLSGSKS